jgi:hypothetical protein
MTVATRRISAPWGTTESSGYGVVRRTGGWPRLAHPGATYLVDTFESFSSSDPFAVPCPDLTGAPIFSETVRDHLRRLDRFATLERGWDSYGAQPISVNAIEAASVLLMSLAAHLEPWFGRRVKPYVVAPLASGGVQLEWRGPSGIIEVDVDPEGTFSYLLLQGAEEDAVAEDNNVSPVVIQELLSEVLSG